ncbi:MAG: hypothetical protein IT577_12070 [Verrucomicrobiae bacterium]|nr:hypothetical protein [Verrucomicrobiae bacterium]
MRALFLAWLLGHWRCPWCCGCALAVMGLAACGERGDGGSYRSAPDPDSSGAPASGGSVVATATAIVHVAVPATGPGPEIRLGRAVEAGPDGEPVPPKR